MPKGSLLMVAGIEKEAGEEEMPPPVVLICEFSEGPPEDASDFEPEAGALRSRFTKDDQGSEAEGAGC
jgi:hypothetical protein